MANELNWWQRGTIGASGGLGLALLKLIAAGFFITEGPLGIQALVAYLTSAAYVVLGALAAGFLTDHEVPLPKMRRSAFVAGLLAPSLLLAIVSAPAQANPSARPSSPIIQEIGGWFIHQAYAQEPEHPTEIAPPIPSGPQLFTMKPGDLEPSFADALLASLGRKAISVPYSFLVGTNKDRERALAAAARVNDMLKHVRQAEGSSNPLAEAVSKLNLKAAVLSPEGIEHYYVVLGLGEGKSLFDNLAEKGELDAVESQLRTAAIQALGATQPLETSTITPADRIPLAWILAGKAVQARALFIPPTPPTDIVVAP